jgi:hypothetical protein
MNELTLQYPAKIAKEIGLSPNEINNFKRQGCRFYGRKTSVAWVREYLDRITGGASSRW